MNQGTLCAPNVELQKMIYINVHITLQDWSRNVYKNATLYLPLGYTSANTPWNFVTCFAPMALPNAVVPVLLALTLKILTENQSQQTN